MINRFITSKFITHLSLTLVVLFTSLTSAMAAEGVSFTTSAPMMVAVGETFRVEFALNASPDKDSFVAPNFPGFDVLAGPAVSQGSSIQIINGKMTRSTNLSYTFVLLAQEAGAYTIASAKVKVDKANYTTKPLPIEVVDESQSQSGASGSSGSSNSSQQQSNQSSRQSQTSSQSSSNPENRVAKDDILLRTTVSRTSLYKGEPLRATIKLYSRVAIAGSEGEKMPSFNGFWAQEIPNNGNRQAQRETYNGKVYETQVLRDYILYPQQSGELVIGAAQMDIVAQVIVQSRNVDPFFGGGHEVYNVRRHISTPEIKINVKNLPAGAPASFTGAVGSFDLTEVAPKRDIASNSASTLTLRIAGSGNLSFVQSPKVEFPESFEKYNVKTTESINLTMSGGSGYKQFEYPFIPRSQGEYTIPAVEFSYFDPKSESYVVRSTQPFVMSVSADENASSSGGGVSTLQRSISKEDVKVLGRDIRFIKIDSAGLAVIGVPFMLSMGYFTALFAILIVALIVFLMVRHNINVSENVVLAKGKKANKVAVQRFKEAKKYMGEQNERAFYEEMMKGLWGYMSDKFNIPVSNLTRESVREELTKRGVSAEDVKGFVEIISQCDEAQYSPLAAAHMGEIYGEALKLISNIETQVKR
ncbi:MAG: BatD family protein [Rikenellaceae bacterium]